MKNLREISAALRRRNQRQYTLLVSCIFISVLLITAYVCMMRSPTVLAIPEGGDSRKQVMMIFAPAVVGCAVFTAYAASLSAYPPAWLSIFYLPLIIGLYMVLLHTVIRGWRKGKSRYRHMISVQGKISKVLVCRASLGRC